MSPFFVIRLVLDFTAAGLLLAALAYWWLDNTSHELIGTGMFILLLSHNVFNRRWWAKLPKAARGRPSFLTMASNISIALTISALLVTSVLISRTVFGFLPLNGGPSAREIHVLAAYWVFILAAVHLGLHWSMIMAVIGRLLRVGAPNPIRTASLRAATGAIVVWSIHSLFVMGIGDRLIARPSIDFWDFQESTIGFFLHHIAILGTCACAAHYAAGWLRWAGGGTRKMDASV
ncbi:DUF4405 domain-containing protein [Rhizobium ruizarguesonis]|uniref:DUF4405 domain-containing protein n=1 Tax=Rhizobium ruizarguesonis TaxID=2081791 RepID=A0AAE5C2S4_9HYPH|nr:DUF4405 domain-containing protein [Rhizobium ruizarguesonis]MBY5806538.1 DUF4405 domain-containing protein [Rhizobium leguminosarum]NKL11210.1 DUF4405 domain-containing protein [Rhizobium leguminosarum bv. viciae]MBY5846327.1 DUF4405 domain-containing protein [Rhizobium leguminosarum]MBY5882188.1 DUF4405 domain-containing protein [Rhizobium leguminosarum]MCB2405048.1 DUF4405 domain-containing protein [Rhizobium ruizarguesonis]